VNQAIDTSGANCSVAGQSPNTQILTQRRVFTGLALYFCLHVVWRFLVSDSVELDESEQVLLTQSWGWGYATQPPLYTWLQKLWFGLVGVNIFGLVSLKCSLLFCTYYFVYRSARELIKDEQISLLAALGLLFVPQIAYESQRDLTHSVLATSLAAVTLFTFLRTLKTGCPRWYALLGLSAGLGLLAKYNFGIFFLLLLICGATLSECRRRVFSPWMLLSVLLIAGVTSGHFLWLLNHRDVLPSTDKLAFTAAGGWVKSYLSAFKSFLQAIISFGGPVFVIFFLVFMKRSPGSVPAQAPEARLVGRLVLSVVVFCALAVLLFRAQFKDRWFQPLLFILPLWLVLKYQNRMSLSRVKLLTGLASGIALLIVLIMPAIPLLAALTQRPNRLNTPWSDFARHFTLNVSPGVIAAGSNLPGGNLKLHMPEKVVLVPGSKLLQAPRTTPWLVVWDPRDGESPPWALQQLVLKTRGVDVSKLKPSQVEAPWKYVSRKQKKLNYLVLPAS
jgi:4-amino-4-deoxy-L-arabinose transferase-like glycosyltransferase